MSIPQILPFERPIYELEEKLQALENQSDPAPAAKEEIRNMRVGIVRMKREIFETLDPWDVVQVARHPNRPQTRDYIELLFDEFVELHGDHAFGDDRAILTGFAKLDGQKVMLVGQHKGRTLQERNECQYGCAHPEGYRKAMEKMELAAKFNLPIICLIDTPGAYPGIGAEERGQAYTIAKNLRDMSRLKVPIVCVVLGEGGSGGALGIGIGDYVMVLEHAYYSVITPEGCAGILWKSNEHRDKAARALKITSKDLLRLEVIDEVVPEPLGGAHRDHRQMAASLKKALSDNLRKLMPLSAEDLVNQRYEKFRRYGQFEEAIVEEASATADEAVADTGE